MAWSSKRKREYRPAAKPKPWAAMYQSRQWKELRAAHRAEYPLCSECERHGVVKAMSDVDHIVPHKGDWQLFLEPSNLQSLCVSCHSRKTARGE